MGMPARDKERRRPRGRYAGDHKNNGTGWKQLATQTPKNREKREAMKNTVKSKVNETKTTDSAVKINKWWATQPTEGAMNLPVVVRLEDGRYGLLMVNLDIVFTGTSGCYKLDAIAKADEASQDGGHAHYSDHEFVLPQDLRKHIVRASISATMSCVADRLAENRGDIPEFSAYVSAEGMKSGHCAAEEITQLADCLTSLDFDQDETEDSVIPNLRGLACECQKLWPHGMHEEQRLSGSGLC
jgi:hypothetical protein